MIIITKNPGGKGAGKLDGWEPVRKIKCSQLCIGAVDQTHDHFDDGFLILRWALGNE